MTINNSQINFSLQYSEENESPSNDIKEINEFIKNDFQGLPKIGNIAFSPILAFLFDIHINSLSFDKYYPFLIKLLFQLIKTKTKPNQQSSPYDFTESNWIYFFDWLEQIEPSFFYAFYLNFYPNFKAKVGKMETNESIKPPSLYFTPYFLKKSGIDHKEVIELYTKYLSSLQPKQTDQLILDVFSYFPSLNFIPKIPQDNSPNFQECIKNRIVNFPFTPPEFISKFLEDLSKSEDSSKSTKDSTKPSRSWIDFSSSNRIYPDYNEPYFFSIHPNQAFVKSYGLPNHHLRMKTPQDYYNIQASQLLLHQQVICRPTQAEFQCEQLASAFGLHDISLRSNLLRLVKDQNLFIMIMSKKSSLIARELIIKLVSSNLESDNFNHLSVLMDYLALQQDFPITDFQDKLDKIFLNNISNENENLVGHSSNENELSTSYKLHQFLNDKTSPFFILDPLYQFISQIYINDNRKDSIFNDEYIINAYTNDLSIKIKSSDNDYKIKTLINAALTIGILQFYSNNDFWPHLKFRDTTFLLFLVICKIDGNTVFSANQSPVKKSKSISGVSNRPSLGIPGLSKSLGSFTVLDQQNQNIGKDEFQRVMNYIDDIPQIQLHALYVELSKKEKRANFALKLLKPLLALNSTSSGSTSDQSLEADLNNAARSLQNANKRISKKKNAGNGKKPSNSVLFGIRTGGTDLKPGKHSPK